VLTTSKRCSVETKGLIFRRSDLKNNEKEGSYGEAYDTLAAYTIALDASSNLLNPEIGSDIRGENAI
jgi:hypothetical protein